MAIPILPIILAVSALGSGIVQGISSVKNANAQAEALNEQYVAQANERARQAQKLMQQQKTSYLKSGIYFNTGSPLEVINETYNTMESDLNAMQKDLNTKIYNLEREGKTAFFSSILDSIANAGMSYFMAGGKTGATEGTTSSTTGTNSLKSKFQNWYQNKTGKNTTATTTTTNATTK